MYILDYKWNKNTNICSVFIPHSAVSEDDKVVGMSLLETVQQAFTQIKLLVIGGENGLLTGNSLSGLDESPTTKARRLLIGKMSTSNKPSFKTSMKHKWKKINKQTKKKYRTECYTAYNQPGRRAAHKAQELMFGGGVIQNTSVQLEASVSFLSLCFSFAVVWKPFSCVSEQITRK